MSMNLLLPTARWAIGALFVACTAPAMGAPTCGVSATPMVFSPYDTLSSSPSLISATLTVSCMTVIGPLAAIPYTVSLGPSTTSGTMSRAMAGPLGSRLQYNLYTSAARSTVWGNGSSGTQTVGGSMTPGSLGIAAVQNHSVYGTIPALQIVRVGAYADGIVVTVDY